VPGPPSPRWFVPVADHLGGAYLRYSFTRGTEQEVGFLVDALGIEAGTRVLDVGCGPGRHAHALARRGALVTGVDVSERFARLASPGAPAGAVFACGDALALPVRDGAFDVALSLCQGGFGLLGGAADDRVVAEMARAARPGGAVVVSAFSSYFQVRYLEDGDGFDAATGVNHERTVVKDEAGRDAEVDLWTTCFTPRELRLVAAAVGLEVEHVWSVTPGAYAAEPPDVDHPEYLLVARRPVASG
jgi:SAM-dependent methyltransferase